MTIEHGYASLDDLKGWLGESRSDNDDLMERAIGSASRVIDAITSRRFWADTTPSTRYYTGGCNQIDTGDFIELVSVAPELQLGVVGSAVDSTTYRGGPINAPVTQEPYTFIEGISFPWGNFAVNAVWGWPSLPVDITQACLMIASRIFKRRESVSAVQGFDEFAVRIGRDDPDVNRLLGRFVDVRSLVG